MKVISPICPKLVAMAMSLEESKNWSGLTTHTHTHKYFPFGEKKIVKVGPVDHEIALHNLKKREIIQKVK